jgi:hypothetical protein
MATLQNIDATYAVSMVPGATQKENIYHYYPPQIAVTTNTTVAWFNNDFGQVLSLIPVLCQLQLIHSLNTPSPKFIMIKNLWSCKLPHMVKS